MNKQKYVEYLINTIDMQLTELKIESNIVKNEIEADNIKDYIKKILISKSNFYYDSIRMETNLRALRDILNNN
jgi:hypothetical protein